jgi:hypothetical protein
MVQLYVHCSSILLLLLLLGGIAEGIPYTATMFDMLYLLFFPI